MSDARNWVGVNGRIEIGGVKLGVGLGIGAGVGVGLGVGVDVDVEVGVVTTEVVGV